MPRGVAVAGALALVSALPGHVRSVRGIGLTYDVEASTPSSGKAFNDAGELVVKLQFGSREGIFVLEAARPVPEPGAPCLLGAGLAALALARALGITGRRRIPA